MPYYLKYHRVFTNENKNNESKCTQITVEPKLEVQIPKL